MESIAEVTDQASITVHDVMTENVHTVLMETLVIEAANLMAEKKLRRVVVTDDKNIVIGVVSQRDVLKSFLDREEKTASEDDETSESLYSSVEIGSLVNHNKVITVSPDIPLIKAAVVLATNKIGCLPVVGSEKELMGLLTITDLLEHYTGGIKKSLESTFKFYSPVLDAQAKMPAYIRKVSGEIVIPLIGLKNRDAVTEFVVLGFESSSGRIIVKFISDNKQGDAMKTKLDSESLVIPARGFVSHFELLGYASAFDVADHDETGYLILTPR